jgi:putative transposase
MESFFSSIQVELLDRREWATRSELANAMFEWIEAFYNPVRRHSGIDHLSPAAHETPPPAAASAA